MFENLSNAPRKTRSIKIGFWLLLLAVIAFGWYVDSVNTTRLMQEEKSRTYEKINVYRTQLESILATNIQLVRGLAIAMLQQDKLDQSSFEQIASPLYRSSGVLRNIGAAPDMKLQYIYPLKGNEKAVGLNYLSHPTQSGAAIKARDTGEIVLAGPLTLQQGGQALIARVPIFNKNNAFWGLLSVVIDIDKLFDHVQLDNLNNRYLVAIQGKDGLGETGEFFYGDSSVLLEQPLIFNIAVSSGFWKLYVYPRGGWHPDSAAIWPFRLALLVIIMLFLAAFIFFNKLLKQLQDNAHSLTCMGALAEVGAWTVNLKTREITWSEVTKKIFDVPDNYKPSWLATTEFFVAGKHRNLMQKTFDDAIKKGVDFDLELMITTAKNHERWILIKGRTVRQGHYTSQIYGSVQNIHARKCLEIEHNKVARNNEILAKLSSHEAVLNLRLDAAQEIAIASICKGLEAQRASIWLLNSDGTQLIPMSFSNATQESLQHFPAWRKKQLPALFSAIFKNEFIRANFAQTHECTKELKDTYLEPYEVNALLGFGIFYKGHAIGLLCAEYQHPHLEWDETDEKLMKAVAATLGSLFASKEQRHARQQAIMEKELAQQSAKMKAEFLASMSHEIRTPMNGVLGMLDVVLHSTLSASQKHHLELAQSSAESLLTIINDILDFSKIEAGKLSVEKIECDLVQVISNSISTFAPKAHENQTTLFLDTHKMHVQYAKTDPNRLKQILNNLLSNAIKFTEKGQVTLSCYTEQQQRHCRLWCSIEDTGVGMNKGQLEKVFNSFTQADISTTRKFGGTGLGLTIAKQLCELLGGSLNAYSKEGIGSTFTFCIELREPAEVLPVKSNCEGLIIIDQLQYYPTSNHFLFDAWGIELIHVATLESGMAIATDKPINNPAFIIAYDIIKQASEAQLSQLQEIAKRSSGGLAVLNDQYLSFHDKIALQTSLTLFRPLTPSDMLKVCQIKSSDTLLLDQITDMSHLRVLLVEDNKVNQIVAQKLLKRFDINVHCEENGQLAVSHLKKLDTPYDIIFMDCMMPELNGYQATTQIRSGGAGKQHQRTSIIAMTANAMQGDKEECLAVGMDDYLAKPIKPEELEIKLRQWGTETKQSAFNSVE